MADSCSSSSNSSAINNAASVPVCETKSSSSDEKLNDTIFVNGKNIKRKITCEEYRQLKDKLFEIEQIKCEERLVHERMTHINVEMEHLQNLLNIVRGMDSNDQIKNSKHRHRRSQQSDSNSHL